MFTGALQAFSADRYPGKIKPQDVREIKGPHSLAAHRISGKITDEQGNPVVGATVSVKGTAAGTTTDDKGRYAIEAEQGQTLVFTSIGYKAKEVVYSGQTRIDIRLEVASTQLNEVVAIGYGTQKKVSLTGAISSLNSKELKTATSPTLSNMLAGKMPGLRVAQRTSEPGVYNTSFDIRGMGAPLIIVDGVPRSDFNRIDPNDVESISILKDASAAVYGVRAANGVVLVTTKRGKAGQVEINYTGTVGGASPTIFPRGLNAYQYATLTNEADINNGAQPTFSKEQLEQYKNGTLRGTDWFGMLTRQYAPQMQHDLSVSGGTEKTTYFFSVGIYDDQGLWKSGSLNDKRYNFRSNITSKITDNLEAQMLLSGFQDTRNTPFGSTTSILNQPLLMPPTLPAYANNNPKYLQETGVSPSNPIALTNAGIVGYSKYLDKSLNGSLVLNYTVPFVPGLKARAMYSYDVTNNLGKSWRKRYPLYTYDNATDTYNPVYRQDPSTLSEQFEENHTSDVQLSLNYEKSFTGRHTLKALLLFEQLQKDSSNFNASKEFTLDAVDQFYAGNAANQRVNSGITSPFANQGIVGRLNYAYMDKYLIEGSFRYDGSSKFAKGHRWGFFPAISVGWRLSEESFIKDNIPAFTNLKLRASWGKLGDDAASTYQFLTGYNYPFGNYVLGDQVIGGLASRGMPNPDITWFTATTTDIGLDGEIGNGMLTFTADIFRRKKNGILASRLLSLPASVGAALPQENLNSNLTQGFEVQVGHAGRAGKFNYNVSANVSFSRTKLLYVERAASTNAYQNWRENNSDRWNDIVWGYTVVGQFTSQEDIDGWAIEDGRGNTTVLPGDLKYQDYNHDGIIDGNDMHPIGRNPNLPEWNFGLTASVTWKGLDLNILLQGAHGYYVNQNGDGLFSNPVPYKRNGLLPEFMDRWHHEDIFDPTSPWVPGKYPASRYQGTANVNYLPSTYWWHSDPYLRVKSIELGYTLPASITKKIVKSVRVFVNGFNMLTWSKVSYIDPEHNTNTAYPIMKNFNGGLNITF
ncbi:TonB-dependent receptor [Compostibacter hankyongensis]|uniref:TonB-dependent receptor n=2 Tax=Compostibacter hankyongensis TaxID=1007089 RepID=A0ABP8FT70_9BACT